MVPIVPTAMVKVEIDKELVVVDRNILTTMAASVVKLDEGRIFQDHQFLGGEDIQVRGRMRREERGGRREEERRGERRANLARRAGALG